MSILPASVLTIIQPHNDPFCNSKDWKRDYSHPVSSFVTMWPRSSEHRIYVNDHSCGWKFGQVLWAAIQTIFTLGLILIAECGRRTWQQACSGKEWAVVHLANFKGGRSGGSDIRIPAVDPVTVPQLPVQPQPLVDSRKKPSNVLPPPPPKPKPNPSTPQKPPVIQQPPAPVNYSPKPIVNQNVPASPLKPVAGTVVKPAPAPTLPPGVSPSKPPAALKPATAANQYDLSGFSPADKAIFLKIESAYDLIFDFEKKIGKSNSPEATSIWNYVLAEELENIYAEILTEFSSDDHMTRHGGSPHDKKLFAIPVRGEVPSYFASAGATPATGYDLRIRSILGLRNLLTAGPEILEELIATLFAATKDAYPAKKGLNKMHYLTGNAVDLEWPLFTCKKGGLRDNEAVLEAEKLIDQFKALFHDYRAKFPARNLDNWTYNSDGTKGVYRTSQHNSHLDRGKCPVWKRETPFRPGEFSYFANVPDINAVVKALLKAPLLFAQSYLILKNKKQDLAPLFDETSLSMACFNQKLETAEKFNKECKALISQSPKQQAIQTYGAAAVQGALTSLKLDEFINDDSILPPINQKANALLSTFDLLPTNEKETKYKQWVVATKAAHEKFVADWKNTAIPEYMRKAQLNGYASMLYFDGKTYKPFDQRVVEAAVNQMITYERMNAEGAMLLDPIRFL